MFRFSPTDSLGLESPTQWALQAPLSRAILGLWVRKEYPVPDSEAKQESDINNYCLLNNPQKV